MEAAVPSAWAVWLSTFNYLVRVRFQVLQIDDAIALNKTRQCLLYSAYILGYTTSAMSEKELLQ